MADVLRVYAEGVQEPARGPRKTDSRRESLSDTGARAKPVALRQRPRPTDARNDLPPATVLVRQICAPLPLLSLLRRAKGVLHCSHHVSHATATTDLPGCIVSPVRRPLSESGGRRFKSCHPDHTPIQSIPTQLLTP